jgi:replicative DNA helicase
MKVNVNPYQSVAENIVDERAKRQEMADGILPFHISFLDDSLGGIMRGDLVLLGGRSGQGKSEMAASIALTSALNGKRVFYFALESDDREIERRCLFKLLSKRFYEDPNRSAGTPDFQDWSIMRQEKMFAKYYDEEVSKLRKLTNFIVRYRGSDFTVEDFERNLISEQANVDLFILDHLHYVDTSGKNENDDYKRIVKKIRGLSLDYGKPVILVAHVRKADRRNEALVPDQEEFQGSSDIFKICTKVITIAPAFDQEMKESYLWATYIRVAKNRMGNARTRFVALTAFDSRENKYDQRYQLGKLTNNGTKWEPVDKFKLPSWATINAR